MAQYIISITACDHAGIVAHVSTALADLNGNIMAASQTVHQGYFAMVVHCDFESEHAPDQISQAIQTAAGEELHVYVTPYQAFGQKPNDEEKDTFIITTIGSDKPGILRAVSTYLASKNINIDDLYCCVKEDDFVVICEVSVPKGMDVFMLQTDLEETGKSLGFTAHVLHENIFVATNQVRLKRLKTHL